MEPSTGTVHHVTAADRGQALAGFLRAKLAGWDAAASNCW